MRPYLKNKESKKGWGMAQVEVHLPGKCKALSSNPSTAKKRNQVGRKERRKEIKSRN
jgi:hypothetical protein